MAAQAENQNNTTVTMATRKQGRVVSLRSCGFGICEVSYHFSQDAAMPDH